jgi:t-SNARE complex subunit (syntaxin)
MTAIVQKDNLKEIQTCAVDGELLANDVESLIADVESLSFSGFFKAIQMTGKIYGEAPFILRECQNLKDDLNTLKQQAAIFLDLGKLTERITKNYVWHYTEIMTAINTANQDATAGNYFGFGENIGDAVFIALQP